mgnify:CR=1 FL=1
MKGMNEMRLPITPQISVTGFLPTDKDAIILHLADREICDHTIGIPFPYGAEEWDQTIEIAGECASYFEQPLHLAIRDADEYLIGVVVFADITVGHKTEVGFWLGKPYWGQNIMAQVLPVVCQFAIEKWNLVRITASIFDGNSRSQRVLEKCGFEHEGWSRKYYFKNGRFIDSLHYALLDNFSEVPF